MDLKFRDDSRSQAYRPTKQAHAIEEELRWVFGRGPRYEVARLSIGRSLREPLPPEPVPSGTERAVEIRGEQLFGEDTDAWLAALVLAGGLAPGASVGNLREAVEAHWHRGALLLKDMFEEARRDELVFIKRLNSLLPESPESATAGRRDDSGSSMRDADKVEIAVGPVSCTLSGEPVRVVLNDAGTSPHIALMGRTRSGKTRTGLGMALEVCRQAAVPILFIDPKGEFVEDGALVNWPSGAVHEPVAVEVGVQPIPLDFFPDPAVGHAEVARSAIKFRDSIVRCCRSVGDVQQDTLRCAIEDAIQNRGQRDLGTVRDAYEQRLQQAGKSDMDSVLSRLREVTGSLALFSPRMEPSDFMQRSWVLSLKKLPGDEVKRLAILLLLDAIADHVVGQPDAPLSRGCRRLRHVLVVDEARKVLQEPRYESLSALVRQGASKGQVVMLLSQDPSDFVGQADDFTTQLGTVVAFACAQSQQGLRNLAGAYGRKLQPQEFSDTYLERGVAFAKLPNRQPERIRAWQP